MDASATPSPSKRVRFTDTLEANSPAMSTPAGLAKHLIKQGLASLDDTVIAFFLRFPTRLFTNRLRIDQKMKAMNKLDTEHLPSSLRFKLSLDCCNDVKSTNEFEELNAAFETTIANFQSESKDIFKSVLQLEIDAIAKDSAATLLKFSDSLIDYFTLIERRPGPLTSNCKHSILSSIARTELTELLKFDNTLLLDAIHCKYHTDPASDNDDSSTPFENPPETSDNTSISSDNISMDSSTLPNQFSASHSERPAYDTNDIIIDIVATNTKLLLMACIKQPLLAYYESLEKASFKRRLSKFIAHEASKSQSDDTTAFINNLHSDNDTTIKSIVDTALQVQKKAFQKKHLHLENQVKSLYKKVHSNDHSKNAAREGSVRPSRSTSKQTQRSQSRTPSPKARSKTQHQNRQVSLSPDSRVQNHSANQQSKPKQQRSKSPSRRSSHRSTKTSKSPTRQRNHRQNSTVNSSKSK
jgi:hypothetical protein